MLLSINLLLIIFHLLLIIFKKFIAEKYKFYIWIYL